MGKIGIAFCLKYLLKHLFYSPYVAIQLHFYLGYIYIFIFYFILRVKCLFFYNLYYVFPRPCKSEEMTKAEGKSLIIFKAIELLRTQGLHSSSFPFGYLMVSVFSSMTNESSYWGPYLPHSARLSGGLRDICCSCGFPCLTTASLEVYTSDISALLDHLSYWLLTLATGFTSHLTIFVPYHTVVINSCWLLIGVLLLSVWRVPLFGI